MYNYCMEKLYTFNQSERKFISLVHRAAFSNPFSEERDSVDYQIVNLKKNKSDNANEVLKILIDQVKKLFIKLDKHGACKIKDFSEKDRELIKYTYLFVIFHELANDFDELIQFQIKSGDKSVKVKFADKAIKKLEKRGLSHTEALRFFSLFYQMRRAFYFISHALTGKCKAMKKLKCSLWNSVFTYDMGVYDKFLLDKMEDFSTLILGETGSGKGSAAAAIGKSGFIAFDNVMGCFKENFNNNFISINLSQYPETLIESELFGYKKGAFTGAIEDYKGVFSLCSQYGSLFLDEIGDVSTHVQIKLLQILQERTFSPVGSHKIHRFKGRVIAATNKSLDGLRKSGKFRDDFYYRLCSDIIGVPTLKHRLSESPDELVELITSIVQRIIGTNSLVLEQNILKILSKNIPSDYNWPGNVRELEQAVRSIFLTGNYKGDISIESDDQLSNMIKKIENANLSAGDLLSNYCSFLYDRYGTYEKVAKITELDRRTVKKYLEK